MNGSVTIICAAAPRSVPWDELRQIIIPDGGEEGLVLAQDMSQESTLKFSDFAGLQLVQVTSHTSIDDCNLLLNSHGNCMKENIRTISNSCFRIHQYQSLWRSALSMQQGCQAFVYNTQRISWCCHKDQHHRLRRNADILHLRHSPYCPCLRSSVRRTPRFSSCCVAASRSDPNWAKAATSRYWASSSFMVPATYNKRKGHAEFHQFLSESSCHLQLTAVTGQLNRWLITFLKNPALSGL